jgi:hypothetical protein
MADFSVILQSPQVRQLVQDNGIQAVFLDGLFPKNLYRMECGQEEWAAQTGDDKLFTGAGLMDTDLRPLRPGVDPTPGDYNAEQWRAVCQKFAKTIDTHMPTAVAAAVNKLLVDQKRLGENCAQTINRLIREKMFNASCAGWTVANGAQNAVTVLRVQRLNGFTRARRPDLSTGSPVRYEPVSTSNPLPITVFQTSGGATAVNVVGYTPDYAGDEIGTGTITVDVAVTVADRDAVQASTATGIVRSGGGTKVDALTPGSDLFHLTDIRSAIARLSTMNVAKMPDGTYHVHLDPQSYAQIYADAEFQILNRGRVDAQPYESYVITKLLGCTFIENNEQPQDFNVKGGKTATYDPSDPFGAEMWTNGNAATGGKVHRPLFIGFESTMEYWVNQNQMITEAGVTGRVETGITQTNNGLQFSVENVQVVMRAPQDRLQEMVAQTWKFEGDWVVRTDGATGDAAAYKRVLVVEHTE